MKIKNSNSTPCNLQMNYDDFRNMGFISLEEVPETTVKPGFTITMIKTPDKSPRTPKRKNLPLWRKFCLHSKIIEFLYRENFVNPTEIQRQVLEDKSLHNSINVISSPTGSGKTLAYLIPILNDIFAQKVSQGISCIIVSPSRDLTLQIKDLVSKILGYSHSCIKVSALCSGICSEKQARILKERYQIIVLTPGKLKEITYNHFDSLACVKFLVIDEADKILDKSKSSYFDLICSFKKLSTSNLSSYFFVSSTLTKGFVYDSGILPFGSSTKIPLNFFSSAVTAHRITDLIHYVLEDDKCPVLINILKNFQHKKVIIFSNLKSELYVISFLLKYFSIENKVIESNIRLGRRNKFINKLPLIEKMVILSTDLTARGIDFYNFDCVIQYSFPNDYETFVHRRGRVGRHSSGCNILFCVPGDSPKVIKDVTEKNRPEPDYCVSSKELKGLKSQIGILKREYMFQKSTKNCKRKDL